MANKLNYNQIMIDASNRLHTIINACINKYDDSIAGLTCSSMYSSEKDIPVVKEEDEQPVIDEQLCFKYKGYNFELSSCNNITNKAQILGLTNENFKQKFPHGIFTDRYVCWMCGHKDCDGHTQEESDEPEYWSPEIYLVPDAWSLGAGFDLQSGAKVDKYVLEGIDKFLETFEE